MASALPRAPYPPGGVAAEGRITTAVPGKPALPGAHRSLFHHQPLLVEDEMFLPHPVIEQLDDAQVVTWERHFAGTTRHGRPWAVEEGIWLWTQEAANAGQSGWVPLRGRGHHPDDRREASHGAEVGGDPWAPESAGAVQAAAPSWSVST
ncbi:hypothetical protein [Streptomyces tsukubensis]|uniref:hypothetical protein n=1 Tax=Streptomyces tsukubensis TaxID=83656 RepID=UPI00344DCE4A